MVQEETGIGHGRAWMSKGHRIVFGVEFLAAPAKNLSSSGNFQRSSLNIVTGFVTGFLVFVMVWFVFEKVSRVFL
ncbi:hypothetical protein SISSUDRAFT_1054338 [Sistotremastrum suecicum HHB10207 ss-3]|uniref:Uncharacterized protein n=1 Tax=Sistotremastrum suecicum HHB10207 ss-3 TaxID=1314776 RepID=A0A165YKX9_9AGAM|nr:hypothetical protein SISSUDRAFT_1054338 [Sistotremastrum suecicum HHB10207 ss-3]